MSPEVGGAVVDLAVFLLVGAFFAFLFWRVVVDRKRLPKSTRVVGTIIFENFQNQDGRAAVEEIVYTQESWTAEDPDGDDVGRRWAAAAEAQATDSSEPASLATPRDVRR